MSKKERLPKFTMPFEPMTIEHLGLKLYTFLPPVIGELISNAWDADADKVEIILPQGKINEDSEVILRDYGSHSGMNEKSLQNCYLPIGRNCRNGMERNGTEHYRRAIMGRKGIGKLSAFGVAREMEIRTIKEGKAICILLNFDDMKKWPKGEDYEPTVIPERTGETDEPNGTEIRLRKLHRTSPIDENDIRRGIARRYTVIDKKFQVIINGKPITHEDRRLKEECRKNGSWDVQSIPDLGNIIDETNGWKVDGWVGIVEKSSQTERGVDIFVRGKAAELETMFGLKTTHIQFARAYVVGEIHADFLDSEEDNISTGRNSVHWESDAGEKLKIWGQKALMFAFKEWLNLQRHEKEEKIIKTGEFDKWLSSRTAREQKVAKKLVKAIVDDQNIEPESSGPLLEIIKTNIEFQAFQDLVDEIEDSGANVQTLLKLINDWRIIEAREHLKLSDGRLEIIDKLSSFIDTGALEVKEIQPLFENEGWLVNPSWGKVTGQNKYSQLLREHCKEPRDLQEKDRRIDIVAYEVGGTIHVVELKRPEKTLSWSDLDQIEQYVYWARSHIVGTGPDAPKYATGMLIVGNLSSEAPIIRKQEKLAGDDIRVETFRDLHHKAYKICGEVERTLKEIAPEYSKHARRVRRESKK